MTLKCAIALILAISATALANPANSLPLFRQGVPDFVFAPGPVIGVPYQMYYPIPAASLFYQPLSYGSPYMPTYAYSAPIPVPYTGVSPSDYIAALTEAQLNQPCLTCLARQRLEHIPLPIPRPNFARHVGAMDDPYSSDVDRSLLARLSDAAVRAATRGREVAGFCGGGYRSGNRSKCMCASGVKEALLNAGVCHSRPAGNAVDMQYSLRICGGLHRIARMRPEDAPFGSVIVYHTTRHPYGHVEIKIQVTMENIAKYTRETGRQLRVGMPLYCSDFCSTVPTRSYRMNRWGRTAPTNFVDAIYSL